MERLVSNAPVRMLRNSRRCLTGKIDLVRGGTAHFESSLERDWLIALDFDKAVQRIVVQPFSLHYTEGAAKRRYTPDVLADYVLPDGTLRTVVYEVKPRNELWADWAAYRPRFKAAVSYCRERQWVFKIVTENEIRTPYFRNATFLRRYIRLPENEIAVEQLLYSLSALGPTTPQALLAASFWALEAQMDALPMLWRLVGLGRIAAFLREPLTMSSEIWLPEN